MPTYEEARSCILDAINPLGVEKVEILESLGRVLAEDIFAPWDMPLWNNTAMDGYAVRAEDCSKPVSLKISGFLPAGENMATSIEPGTAIKILTGAPIPPGADAVVPFEETEESADTVSIKVAVKVGDHIRFKGEDVKTGELIIPAGTVIRPYEISMLASRTRSVCWLLSASCSFPFTGRSGLQSFQQVMSWWNPGKLSLPERS
ncbi:MAG: molybdenum cofactor biosynthesis protein MoeA [Geobacteraceae bacterium]|nr:molybdenum cofactor biosynthesis protein MoeA [Geobacteraceae bacterium]